MAKSHVSSLDGVRGIAILLVLLIHLELFRAVPGTSSFMLHVRDLFWTGWVGVDLFFVLSGFLITGILLDAVGRPRYFYNFYARRVLRIFPLYYFTLTIAFASALLIVPRLHLALPAGALPTRFGWFSYLFYFQNWRLPDSLLGHFWSLGVEEQFYLMWPICVYCLSRRSLVRLCATVFIACLVGRLLTVHYYPGSPLLMQNTFARVDTLLVGGFCAIAVRDNRLMSRICPALPFIATASLAGMIAIDYVAHEIRTRSYYTQSFGYSLLALGFGAFVLWAYLHNDSGSKLDRFLRQNWLRSFGKYSYGIYVYHHPIFLVGTVLFTGVKIGGYQIIPSVPYCICLIAISFIVARISYAVLETPFLNMKRFFEAKERILQATVS